MSLVVASATCLLASLPSCGSDEPSADGTGSSSNLAGESNSGGAASGGRSGTGGKGGSNPGAGGNTSAGGESASGGESGSATGGVLGGTGSQIGAGGDTSGDPTECNDGIDNDGDGQTDYDMDPGCFGPGDGTEKAGPRSSEKGFSTWDFADDSVIVYVSNDGDDGNDGLSPENAVATIDQADKLVRDGKHDFIRLRRGDVWRDEALGRFKSGLDAEHPIVVGSYGTSLERPLVELSGTFINLDGQEKSNMAFVDIHFRMYEQVPDSPDFTGSSPGVFRLVGTGANFLVEGCHLEYGDVDAEGYPDAATIGNVEIRASMIERVYEVGTCDPSNPEGNSNVRRSGILTNQVDGLTLEGNVFDHNGWNDEVDGACATIYNHNVYLNGNHLHLRDNVFSRASSIHVKLKNNETAGMIDTIVQGNLFVEGEIGVSIGGNKEAPLRFKSTVISDNVFSDIGRSNPTTRGVAWGVDVVDNEDLMLANNYFLNQAAQGADNSFGVQIGGATAKDIVLDSNLFYRIQNRGLRASVDTGHESVTVKNNTFVDPDLGSCLVSHSGSFSNYQYSDNQYYSASSSGGLCWDKSEGSVGEWTTASGETDAQEIAEPEFIDPSRSIESYTKAVLGGEATIDAYMELAREQSRLNWNPALSAAAINAYIAGGFAE